MGILLACILPFVAIISLFILILGLVFFVKNNEYQQSEYYNIIQFPMQKVYNDKGRFGEYYTYKYLEKFGGEKRYLFNCYLPKEDGTTTEIDVIFIHETGVYVLSRRITAGGYSDMKNNAIGLRLCRKGGDKRRKRSF